ncbi:Dicer 1 [Operophtera brumata]|uniref:Dicer 1 n=1 Tax=Operophtera brumata TaxID=104452 RepID=A0A0L7LTV6_OPEBR|nr:Dicer 1 [Operophtera brumata]
MLYAIESSLWCALPERYNTRGRRLHAPQHANQALAILMARDEPTKFMQFVFTEVLRVRRRGMTLDDDASTRNNYYIVPTLKGTYNYYIVPTLKGTYNYYIVPTLKVPKDGALKIDVDWAFLEQIYNYTEQQQLADLPLYPHQTKICSHLTPDSAFPSPTHDTFRTYYRSKYKVTKRYAHTFRTYYRSKYKVTKRYAHTFRTYCRSKYKVTK